MTTLKPYRACLLAIALALALSSAAWACPGCKDALDSSENGGDLARGFFWSILFMLSMPPLILAGLGTAMYLSIRRARAAQALAKVPATAQPAGAPIGTSIGATG
jgi:hypothetical protein